MLTWISDSSSVESVHRNGVGLSFDQSFIGQLEMLPARSTKDPRVWGYRIGRNGALNPVGSYARARVALERAAMTIASEYAAREPEDKT